MNPCTSFWFFDQKWKLEKIYESKGNKPKLCSYKPVGGKSTLAHLFGFFGVYTQEAVHPGGVHPGGREDTQRWGGYTHGEVQGTPRGGKHRDY